MCSSRGTCPLKTGISSCGRGLESRSFPDSMTRGCICNEMCTGSSPWLWSLCDQALNGQRRTRAVSTAYALTKRTAAFYNCLLHTGTRTADAEARTSVRPARRERCSAGPRHQERLGTGHSGITDPCVWYAFYRRRAVYVTSLSPTVIYGYVVRSPRANGVGHALTRYGSPMCVYSRIEGYHVYVAFVECVVRESRLPRDAAGCMIATPRLQPYRGQPGRIVVMVKQNNTNPYRPRCTGAHLLEPGPMAQTHSRSPGGV
jgi:hypothetical protein